MNNTDHYYESLNLSYQLPSSPTSGNNNRPLPLRKAPLPPTSPTTTTTILSNNNNNNNTGTLSHYQNDCMGIPFILNPRMTKLDVSFQMPKCNDTRTDTLDYDFNLEREILCSTKDEKRRSNNPFF